MSGLQSLQWDVAIRTFVPNNAPLLRNIYLNLFKLSANYSLIVRNGEVVVKLSLKLGFLMRMRMTFKTASPVILALAFIVSVSVARADTVTFVTPPGSTTSGGPVDASAVFTTSAGSLSVTLTNLQANIKDVAQALSDLSFTIAGQTTGSLASSGAQELTVNGNGTFSLGASLTTTAAVGWVFSNSGGVFTLDVLQGPGHAGPAHLIIGPPGPGALYSNTNGSIAGNGPHNPFLNQTATFTIDIPTLTAASLVTGATFSFGTTEGANLVPGVPSAVPLPAALPLFATCLGALGLLGWRRKRKTRSILPA
jgi:hypothetical protein